MCIIATASGVSATRDFLTARYTATGTLDTSTFGAGAGYVMTDFQRLLKGGQDAEKLRSHDGIDALEHWDPPVRRVALRRSAVTWLPLACCRGAINILYRSPGGAQ
jgi:hypothetical protein